MKTLQERFDEKYIPEPMSGCWLWTGGGERYGRLRIGRKNEPTGSAHIISYQLHKGPTDGHQVHHTCDTPCCVNPDHLWIGNQTENLKDAARKKRLPTIFQKGDGRPRGGGKLTQEIANEIRRSPLSERAAAKVYGVERSTIGLIRRGKTWTAGR